MSNEHTSATQGGGTFAITSATQGGGMFARA